MMNKSVIVSLLFVAAIGVAVWLVVSEPSATDVPIDRSEESSHEKFSQLFPSPKDLERENEVSRSSDINIEFDPAELNGYTDDEEAMKLIAYLSNNPPYGKSDRVKITRGSPNKLFIDGEEKFEAAQIYDYSISENGVIAIEAVTGDEYPSYKDPNIDFSTEKDFLPVSYGEIWIIGSDNELLRITDENTNGSYPCISKDGKKLAFKANLLTVRNRSLEDFLMVVDLETGRSEKYSSPLKTKEHHVISPVMWINDGKTLRVIEDYGETGGHLTVGYINF